MSHPLNYVNQINVVIKLTHVTSIDSAQIGLKVSFKIRIRR